MTALSRILQESSKSFSELSVETGIAEVRIRALASGAEASMGELRLLASAFKASVTDLLEEPKYQAPAQLLFRKAVQEKPRFRSSADEQWLRLTSKSLELIDRNACSFDWFKSIPTVAETYAGAEELSLQFRGLFFEGDDLSPMLQLPEIVEGQLGIPVLIAPSKTTEGASAVVQGLPFVFVAPRFPPRMLFTLAHEVGHILAHHDLSQDFVTVDEDEGNLWKSKDKSERFADAFASCLLLPRRGLGIALNKIREFVSHSGGPVGDVEILYVAYIFGVSFEVAARRCEALELLPQGGALSLYEELCKSYGSPEKRAVDAGLPPRNEIRFPPVSNVLLSHAIRKVRQERLSIGRAAALLQVTVADLTAFNAPPLQ